MLSCSISSSQFLSISPFHSFLLSSLSHASLTLCILYFLFHWACVCVCFSVLYLPWRKSEIGKKYNALHYIVGVCETEGVGTTKDLFPVISFLTVVCLDVYHFFICLCTCCTCIHIVKRVCRVPWNSLGFGCWMVRLLCCWWWRWW